MKPSLTEKNDIGLCGSEERRFLDWISSVNRSVVDTVIILVRISQLHNINQQPYHLKIITYIFQLIIGKNSVLFYRFYNDDIIVIGQKEQIPALRDACKNIVNLFTHDPLFVKEDGKAKKDFISWYESHDYVELKKTAEQRINQAYAHRDATLKKMSKTFEGLPSGLTKKDLTPSCLVDLIQSIRNMDLSRFLQKQVTYSVIGDGLPISLSSEYFISIYDLGNTLFPDVNLTSDKWLFQHLTEYLDKYILTMVPNLKETEKKPISININVETLLSDEFLEFNRRLSPERKKRIILELQPHDVLGNTDTFMFARNFCHHAGFKVCLDGLNHMTFPLLDRLFLRTDMVKVVWSAYHWSMMDEQQREGLEAAVKRTGASRIILCRCDSEEAVSFGQKLGIQFFQGHFFKHMTLEV